MKALLVLCLFFLTVDMGLAQPFPVPQEQTDSSAVTYDARGNRYETFKTSSGWVTYGPSGERFDTIEKPDGGSVTYGAQGERWETFPGLVTSPPRPMRTPPE